MLIHNVDVRWNTYRTADLNRVWHPACEHCQASAHMEVVDVVGQWHRYCYHHFWLIGRKRTLMR